MKNNLNELEKAIAFSFRDRALLVTALTHPSYVNENKVTHDNYQRFEFFGDAILELIVSEYLYMTLPNIREGRLTEIRSALVRTENLAKCARKIDLGKFILLSKGEALNHGQTNQNILADVIEALIAAIYLDQGLDQAKLFFNSFIKEELNAIINQKKYLDPKTSLQEIFQAQRKITPIYKVMSEKKMRNNTIFEIAVMIKNKELARGNGKSKKLAEHQAAVNALGKL